MLAISSEFPASILAAEGWWCWELARAGTLAASSRRGAGSILPVPGWWGWRPSHGINKIFTCLRDVFPSYLDTAGQSLLSVVRHKSQIAALPVNVCVRFFLHQCERYQGIWCLLQTVWKLLVQEENHCQALGIAIYTCILNSSCSWKIWFKNSIMTLYSSDFQMRCSVLPMICLGLLLSKCQH